MTGDGVLRIWCGICGIVVDGAGLRVKDSRVEGAKGRSPMKAHEGPRVGENGESGERLSSF